MCGALKAAGESVWMRRHGVNLSENANRNNVMFNLAGFSKKTLLHLTCSYSSYAEVNRQIVHVELEI